MQQDHSAVGPSFSSDMFYIASVCIQSHIEEELLDGNYIVITTQFKNDFSSINTYVLVDCGTTGYTIIDKEFAHNHEFPLYKLKKPYCLKLINGRCIESGLITHMTKLPIIIASHSELILLFVTKLGHCPIVLGLL